VLGLWCLLALGGLAWTGIGLTCLAGMPSSVRDELPMEGGTLRLHHAQGSGGQSFDDVGFQPPNGDERIVLRTFRSHLREFERTPWPVAMQVQTGTLRMGVPDFRELHGANRFRRIYCNQLDPESESNLGFDLSIGMVRWGGLLPLLLLPFIAWWASRRRRMASIESPVLPGVGPTHLGEELS